MTSHGHGGADPDIGRRPGAAPPPDPRRTPGLPPPWERRTTPLVRPHDRPIYRPHELFDETELIPRIPLEDDDNAASGDKNNSRLLASSGSIAIATLTSRITGFLKQMLLLAVLGGSVASSYTVASQIPNMISEFVLGAVLTAIVVPVLVRAEREDADGGADFVRRLVTAAVTVLAVATLLAVAAAPILTTRVFLSSSGRVSTELTTALSYLLLPAILFYGISALFMAILNTKQVFRPGAWAPVLNNLTVLAVLGVYTLMPGRIDRHDVHITNPKLLVLGVGLTLGVVVQACSMLPAIRRAGIDLRPLWGLDARLKKAAGLGLAIILYVGISQFGFIIATKISSTHDDAGPAIYNQAWLLLQLPYGVLGVTLLTAIMPRLSRNAAADDTPAVVDDLSVATRLTMIAIIPVVTFMTVTGPQIGQALFGHGHFSWHDATRLGEAVSWSAFTLIPYALVLIHLRVFYAREQAWTPTWIIIGITAVKVALSALAPVIATNRDQIVMLLGVANGAGFAVGAGIGGYLLHRSLGNLRMANVGRTVWRVVLASLAGGVTVLVVDRTLQLHRLSHSLDWAGSLLRVAFGAAVMLTVTFAIMRLAGIPEIVGVTVAVSRRLGLGSATPIEPDQARPPTPYDPLMDAETMILPVIRADTFGGGGNGAFPYPVRQTDVRSTLPAPAPEGVRVSDDPATGLPTGRRGSDTAAGATGTVGPASMRGVGGPDDNSEHMALPGAAMNPPSGPPRPDYSHPHPSVVGSDTATSDTSAPPTNFPSGPYPAVMAEQMSHNPRGPELIPGASVAGGRYRLLAAHGGARGLVFWQALDIKLDREVALTFVDADQRLAHNQGEDGPQAILSRTLRLGRISSPGLARVLDVVRGSSGGIVVAEWTPGRSLREMAETRPSPIGAARAVAALAQAAEIAHRGGGALSIDHPDRIRISVAGDAVLAFPGTLADADVASDVRGVGAMLYALILARWPLGGAVGAIGDPPGAVVGGLLPADYTPHGIPVEPRAIRPEVPFEISAVTVRALEPNQGVRTAATLQHVLEQASVVDQKTEMLPSMRVGQRATRAGLPTLSDPEAIAAEQARSKRMMLILVGLGGLIVLVLALIGWWLATMLAGSSNNGPLSSANIGLTTPSAPAPQAAPAEPTQSGDAGSLVGGVPVPASDVSVFSPQGTPDDPAGARNILNNSPSSQWHSDTYQQQFPTLKPGVGLLATLPNPARLTSVAIDSPSKGTAVQVRSAPTDAPTLDQTQVVGSATLDEGVTRIPVKADQPIRYVLIWITQLAPTSGGQFQSSLADVNFTASA